MLGEPADWQREIYELVAACTGGTGRLAVGADVVAVDKAARDVIAEAGHGDHFAHVARARVGWRSTRRRASGRWARVLAAGMAVTVEPGVYLPGHGGVRIEDTVVTDDVPDC